VRAVKGLAVLCVIVAYALVLSEGGFMGAEDHYVFGFLEKNYVTGLFYFTLGWAIHHLRSGQRPSRAKGLLGSALAAALFILAAFTDFEVNSARLDELWLFMFCGVVVYFFSFTTMAGTMTTAARLCAESSYGIYLWHVPLMLVMTAFARAIEIKFGYSLMGTHVMDAAFLILLPLIAWGSYRLLELPGKKILRQRLTGKQTSTASATL
jgi:peptidoglycan/LPS O-acetylase OafA/YrhL